MGDTKQNLKPSTPASDGIFARFKKDKKQAKTNAPPKTDKENFVDNIAESYSILGRLIAGKQQDLANEKGREQYNASTLYILKGMNTHLEGILELCGEHGELDS
jgi:hypothetical protein